MILLFSFVAPSIAQENADSLLKHGIQFQIENFLKLSKFDNYTFSYRYLLNSNSGLRFGVSPVFINTEDVFTQIIDSTVANESDIDNISQIKFSVQYLTNIVHYKKFSFLIGAGPFISYSIKKKTNNTPTKLYNINYVFNSEYLSYGLEIVSGVEYRLAENVILSGEYSLSIFSLQSDYSKIESKIYNEENREITFRKDGKTNSFFIKGNSVNLGLAIFF